MFIFADAFKGFLILALIFIPLERLFSLHKQKVIRQGWINDTIYYFTGNFIGKLGLTICTIIAVDYLVKFIDPNIHNFVSHQPLFLQLIEVALIGELGYYTTHRLLHTIPYLWQFHAIHHSINDLDWLAAVRVHPCDQIFTRVFQLVPILCFGFPQQTLVIYYIFSAGIAFFIHGNIKFRFPILRWIIVTPEFHHYHHSNNPKIYHSNFSAQLPIIDFVFGTFYLPKGQLNQDYGIKDKIPNSYVKQLIYPFEKIANMINRKLLLKPIPIVLLIGIIVGSGFILPQIITEMPFKTWLMSLDTNTITVKELKEQNLAEFILIDVRDTEEYAEDHIKDSFLVPLIDIEAGFGVKKIQEIVAKSNKNNPTIILYCTSGYRSIKAYKVLEKRGIKSLVLAGGIKAWRK